MGTKIHRRLGRHTIFINHLINPSPKQSGRGVSLPFPADKQRLRELTALGAVTQRCLGPPPSPPVVLLFAAGPCRQSERLWEAGGTTEPGASPRDNEAAAWLQGVEGRPWVGGPPASSTDGPPSFLLPDQATPQP